MIKGKILFLKADMKFTQLVVNTTYFVPILLYVDVAILAGIAIYSISFTLKPPILVAATILFLGRTPYVYQLFTFMGLNLHIVSDLFNSGFLLCLILYLLTFSKKFSHEILLLSTFLTGFSNALIGVGEGIMLTLQPTNYNRDLRAILETADFVTWAIFLLVFFVTVCTLCFSTLITKLKINEEVEELDDEDEEEYQAIEEHELSMPTSAWDIPV